MPSPPGDTRSTTSPPRLTTMPALEASTRVTSSSSSQPSSHLENPLWSPTLSIIMSDPMMPEGQKAPPVWVDAL